MVKRIARHIALIFLFGLFSQPSYAQVNAPKKTSIELNGKQPPELLQDWEGSQRVLYWSEPDTAWLEIFRAKEVVGLVEDDKSYFKRIVADGRQWQWRDAGFVPLISDVTQTFEATSDEDYNAAYVLFKDSFDFQPDNSPANSTTLLRLKSGETIKVVQLVGQGMCAMGGSLCPLVVLRPDREPIDHYLDTGIPWIIIEAGDSLYLEYQMPTFVGKIDLDTGKETELQMIKAKLASSPPRPPRFWVK